MLERCRVGRDAVQKFLDGQNRIRWMRPEGAFYGFLHIEGLHDSLAFASDLVKRARVGVAPGSAFGPPGDTVSDSYVRIRNLKSRDEIVAGFADAANHLR